MEAEITAIRGPIINSTYNPDAPDKLATFQYLKDALIILKGNTILEFGPAKSLKHKTLNIKHIKLNRECRIIRSIV